MRLGDVPVKVLEPYSVDPLVLAEHLLATTRWWRPARRRRLHREIARLRRAASR